MPKSLRKQTTPAGPSLRLSGINYLLVAAGVVSVVIGYVLLAHGSIVAAPLLLVLGYVVLLPLGIIR
ncbi:MAG TPA: hypothetical protein VJ957_04010 [Longimicrobiales bacterium]|nr:hypothetical protein [Longimicrobiales bacterium]